MIQVYKIDSKGFYIEPVILNDNELVPADCVSIAPPNGLYQAQFVNGVWAEGKPASDIINYMKDQKKAEFEQKCTVALVSGFASSALGVAHTYPSHDKAQSNFNTEMNRFLTDTTYTSCKFYTEDAGWLVHTKDQFFKAFNDGHDFGNAQWDKLFGLLAKVDGITATDVPTAQSQLDAITW